MYYHTTEAKYIGNYILWLQFENGKRGEVDFSKEFDGLIFEPLNNIEYFKNFKIQGKTLFWENGADFAPEYLYELIENKGATVIKS